MIELSNSLPYNLEAETSVLGSILLDPELIHVCDLKPEEFFNPRHRLIMEYMYFLKEEDDRPIDHLLIAEYAGKNIEKIGGLSYLMEMRNSVPSALHFTFYQDIVHKKAQLRKTMKIMSETIQKGAEADNPGQLIDESILPGVLADGRAMRRSARPHHQRSSPVERNPASSPRAAGRRIA